jgi:hypothetical protein
MNPLWLTLISLLRCRARHEAKTMGKKLAYDVYQGDRQIVTHVCRVTILWQKDQRQCVVEEIKTSSIEVESFHNIWPDDIPNLLQESR